MYEKENYPRVPKKLVVFIGIYINFFKFMPRSSGFSDAGMS
jgi:hypothetical protein